MPASRKMSANKIMPCLWFDTEAEQAAKFYVSLFENSKLGDISRYTKEGTDIHGKPAGSHPGRGWTMVRATHLTPEHILRAVR